MARKAAELGNLLAQAGLGSAYLDKKLVGLDPDAKLAEKWLLMAAAHKTYADDSERIMLASAQITLAAMYLSGDRGLRQDIPAATELLKRAADLNTPTAMVTLGALYERGAPGLAPDWTEAKRWYEKARNSDEEGSIIYASGRMSPDCGSDEKKVALANSGDLEAQYEMGSRCFGYSPGYRTDVAKAIGWYIAAARQGHLKSQVALAQVYDLGDVGAQPWEKSLKNPEQAAYWYKQAADKGDISALYHLGVKYKYGEGTPQNFKGAFEIMNKLASTKCDYTAASQYYLGDMYEKGQGVSQDLAKAKYWYGWAASNKEQNAIQSLERLKK